MIKKIKENYIYIFIFAIFLVIGLFVPVGGDDWEISTWYNNEGIFSLFCKSVSSWLTYNGRIMNNFFDMFLSKYGILWAFVSALVHTSTIYFLLKIFKLENNKISQFLLLILFLMISSGLRMEIQFHKIGNISYTIPSLAIFFSIYLIYKYKNKVHISNLKYLWMFLLGLFCSLWIENLTIAFLCTITLIAVIDYIRKKKVNKTYICLIFGCLVGCFILFLSPGFLNRYNSSTNGFSVLDLFLSNFSKVLYDITLEQKTVYALYGIISFIALYKRKENNHFLKLAKVLKAYYLFMIGALLINGIVCEFNSIGNIFGFLVSIKNAFFSSSSIYCILFMISILLSVPLVICVLFSNIEREKSLILCFLSFISIAPMVLSPGYRNYILFTYSLFIVIVLIFSSIKFEKFEKEYKNFCFVILGLVCCCRLENYHYVLFNAYKVSVARNDIIREYKLNQKLEKDVPEYLILPMYDENEIISTLNSTYYIPSIIKYYGLNSNTKILFDDHFLYQGINISQIQNNLYKIKINLLNQDVFQFNLNIYNLADNGLVYSETKQSSEFDVELTEKGSYLFNITISNINYGYVVKNETKEVG